MIHRANISVRRAGFSVLELTLALSILAGVMASLALLGSSGYSAYQGLSQASEVEADARRALDRAVSELSSLSVATMWQDPRTDLGTDVLDFQQVTGFAAGAATLGTPLRLAFEYDPGETDDGTDEDGDGLIDEGRLILTRNVGAGNEVRIVLCRDLREHAEGEVSNGADDNGNGVVDERGFNIHQEGDLLTIRLTVQALDAEQRSVVRTVQTSILLRNQG